MNYEEALKEWGARKLELIIDRIIDRSTVTVSMDFDEGYTCCGGRDPDCYCSFAESPSASVTISGWHSNRQYNTEISHWSFDFVTILKEIVEAGGGTITGNK